jgi:hypothetical protein
VLGDYGRVLLEKVHRDGCHGDRRQGSEVERA